MTMFQDLMFWLPAHRTKIRKYICQDHVIIVLWFKSKKKKDYVTEKRNDTPVVQYCTTMFQFTNTSCKQDTPLLSPTQNTFVRRCFFKKDFFRLFLVGAEQFTRFGGPDWWKTQKMFWVTYSIWQEICLSPNWVLWACMLVRQNQSGTFMRLCLSFCVEN